MDTFNVPVPVALTDSTVLVPFIDNYKKLSKTGKHLLL